MDESDDATEAASQFLHVADLCDQVVGRSNNGGSGDRVSDVLDCFVRGLVYGSFTAGEGSYGVEVVVIEKPLFCLFLGFLLGLGDVPTHDDPPVFAINSVAVLYGGFFGKAPLVRQGPHTGFGHGADGKDTGAVFAG